MKMQPAQFKQAKKNSWSEQGRQNKRQSQTQPAFPEQCAHISHGLPQTAGPS